MLSLGSSTQCSVRDVLHWRMTEQPVALHDAIGWTERSRCHAQGAVGCKGTFQRADCASPGSGDGDEAADVMHRAFGGALVPFSVLTAPAQGAEMAMKLPMSCIGRLGVHWYLSAC